MVIRGILAGLTLALVIVHGHLMNGIFVLLGMVAVALLIVTSLAGAERLDEGENQW